MIRIRVRIARRIKDIRGIDNISKDKRQEAIYSFISLSRNYKKEVIR